VAFSPDGTRIVTGSNDGTAKMWDARTGATLLDLKGH
jgi:WD40 repeat protein